MAETAAPKESRAQKAERLKRELNPWHALDEIRRFAREGRTSVPEDWSTYFRWWGIYTQGDGLGVTGGKGGEGKATEYFMMRVAIANGILSADQVRVLGDIARRYANNLADITVRQNIQYHWLTVESLPDVMEALHAAGLTNIGACGDVVRNVTGCPLAGIAHDELIDASPLALEIARELRGNDAFYNLPRKFKISVSGCPAWCNYPEINDIAFTAVRRGDEVGYSVRVGGGLSNEPHLAVRLNAFVRQDQALAVARAITEISRDELILRESRDRARMKYLFTKFEWSADRFLFEVERRLGYSLDPGVEEQIPDDILRDHAGIHRQKQPGLSHVGASVLRGRLTGDQLTAVAELAERFGSPETGHPGQVRLTVMQNLLFLNVPTERAGELARELDKIGLRVEGSQFWRGGIACTGTEFCKLAITETKGFLRWLVDELDERLPQFDQQLRLHVTGCPNGCGQHWIADIGLEGKKIKHEGKLTDAYSFLVGGSVGKHAGMSRSVGYRTPAALVPEAVERLLRHYLADREAGENLRAWFSRYTDAEIRAVLAGEPLATERDLVAGSVPAEVAG